MKHRHLDPNGFSSAAIDDIISRGGWQDWAELREAVLRDREILERVARVSAARVSADDYAQRHFFWQAYVDRHKVQEFIKTDIVPYKKEEP